MHPAQLMITGCPTPSNAMLIGYIDRHPADQCGLGYAVLLYAATGIEMAWDGHKCRSLPNNWRKKVTLTPISPGAATARSRTAT